jgi:hypothetical protein
MLRRRYQQGSIFERGKKNPVWVGRWLLDEYKPTGQLHRKYKSQVLGLVVTMTQKLARRKLAEILAPINAMVYKPEHQITFEAICIKWEQMILPQHKPSSRATERSHLKRLRLDFGSMPIVKLNLETIQKWISGLTCSPKHVRNIMTTFRLIWTQAQQWGYISDEKKNPFDLVKLPSLILVSQPVFEASESLDIIRAAEERFQIASAVPSWEENGVWMRATIDWLR